MRRHNLSIYEWQSFGILELICMIIWCTCNCGFKHIQTCFISAVHVYLGDDYPHRLVPPQKKMTSLRRNVGDPQSQGGASSRYPGESRWLGTPHLQKGARTETQTSILSILSHLLCRGSSCIFIRSQMEAMDQLVVCSIWQGCGCVWFRTAVFGICK